MAEGLAVFHGHPEGVILNDDVHPDQWLVDVHGNVKLNDMSKWGKQAWVTTAEAAFDPYTNVVPQTTRMLSSGTLPSKSTANMKYGLEVTIDLQRNFGAIPLTKSRTFGQWAP